MKYFHFLPSISILNNTDARIETLIKIKKLNYMTASKLNKRKLSQLHLLHHLKYYFNALISTNIFI